MLTWDIPVFEIVASGVVTAATILASFWVARRETARAINAQAKAERQATAAEVVAVLSELSRRAKRLSPDQRTRWLAALARVRTSEPWGSEVAMWLDGVLRSWMARDQATLTLLDRDLFLGPEALHSQVDICLARWINDPQATGMQMWGGIGARTAAAMAAVERRQLRPMAQVTRRIASVALSRSARSRQNDYADGH